MLRSLFHTQVTKFAGAADNGHTAKVTSANSVLNSCSGFGYVMNSIRSSLVENLIHIASKSILKYIVI